MFKMTDALTLISWNC